MKKKIKILILLIILIILILCCKNIFYIKSLNYSLDYKEEHFNIYEKYEDGNYYIEIKHKDKIYPVRIDKKNTNKKIINKVYYFKDNTYECLLPVIDNKILTDIMCYSGNIIYNYHDVVGKDNKLDEFVATISEYNINQFKDNNIKKKTINNVDLYTENNIQKNIAITTYNGLVTDFVNIKLFDTDLYNNKISAFVDNFYLVADYENQYEFKYFYVVDLNTKKIKKIKSKYEISYDSYIQGIVDDKVYLYDKDNENQYEIDVKKEKINIISKDDNIKYYKNKKWETMSKTKANKEIYFDYTSLENNFTDFDEVIETNNYFYLLKQNINQYDLYRVDKENIDIYKFIGIVPTNLIYYKDNYLYYVYENELYFYSDIYGKRTLLKDDELQFNDTIKYYIN